MSVCTGATILQPTAKTTAMQSKAIAATANRSLFFNDDNLDDWPFHAQDRRFHFAA